MKRWLLFIIVVWVVLAAGILSELRKAEAPVSPDPLIYLVADTERELTRLPVAFKRLSDEEEIKIGDAMALRYIGGRRAEGEEAQTQARMIEAYVSRVGSRVAAYAHRKLPYRFHYIPNMNFINAFALPGGHVFIGGGLMSFMDSEDELASVLGHEVEHIDHYHCAERAQMEARLRKLPLGGLLGLPIEIFVAGYSKDQELEADREGTRLAVWAGYSPLGALRMFETFERLYAEYVSRARSPQQELTQVAVQTIQDYFRSHPATSDRLAQIRRMITDEHGETRTKERDLEVAYFFWTERARQACEAGKYDRCAGLASQSLTANANQPQALELRARAKFMLADFAGAAEDFRQYLATYSFPAARAETYLHDVELMNLYADSLSARGDPAKAATEFRTWANTQFASNPPADAQVDMAGLDLLTGKDLLTSQVARPDAPALIVGRAGWWYYRAGRYDDAATLLARAVEQRPGVETHMIMLGWALIEKHNYESALARFERVLGGRRARAGLPGRSDARASFDDAPMGIAVAHWQANQKGEALKWFSGVTVDQSQWLNPRWVKALYSPLVLQSIAEMQAEQQKRRPARVAGRG